MTRSLLALAWSVPVLLTVACSGDAPRAKADAADTVAGTVAGSEADPCSLLSTAEVTKQFGTMVESGEMAGMGTGCQWMALDNDTAYAMIGIVRDTSEWSNPISAPSYEPVTGIDGEGFSVEDPQGGWRAEARNGKGAYAVLLIGAPSATREGAVALLRKLLERD
jgi:hypothetical protein